MMSPPLHILSPHRLLPAALLGGLLALACGCATSMSPPETVSSWRVGPFLEGGKTAAGDKLLAVRPFYSHEEVAFEPFRSVTDILWPVGAFHQRGDRRSWRFIPFYGFGDDAPEADGAYRFRLFPIYFEGRTLDGEEYRALFPVYGEIRDFLGFDTARFVLFPIYGTSQSRETTTRTVLWPFYLTRHGPKIDQLRLWPFYSKRVLTGAQAQTRRFVLWPFWNDFTLDNEFAQGEGFIFFPFYGHSRIEQRKLGLAEGWTVLPPFFSRVRRDDGYQSLRAPWPFIHLRDHADERQRHLWPIYGSVTNAVSREWYALWPIVRGAHREQPRETVDSFSITPFYLQEKRYAIPAATAAQAGGGAVKDDSAPVEVTDRYHRLWPLFSWQRNADGSRLRIPELTLFRRSAAVERNWAPLWSLFVRRERADGARATDLLWGLAAWGRDNERRSFLQLLWVFRLRGSQPEVAP